MRYSIVILLGLYWGQGMSQDNYPETLSLKLAQIRKLDFYDNKIVIGVDTVEYHDLSFPYWKSNGTYYQDDVVRYKYCQYAALKQTKGQRPDTSKTAWILIQGSHPYLFLRDTARLEDLKGLLLDKHPYVKMYAFGALSFRREKDLFPIIVDNLRDTTQVLEYTGDYGTNAYPADLMIQYEANRLSGSERKKLKGLIKQKYSYLDRGLEILSRK